MTGLPATAYLWGEDAFSIERAERSYAARLSAGGEPMDVVRTGLDGDSGDEAAGASVAKRRARTLDDIAQHLGMAPLFGAGTLVVVRQPAGLLAEKGARERLLALVATVPPGNALCITDLIATGAKGPAARGVLRDAVAAAGGLVEEFTVPTGARLERWLDERAHELDITLEPPAARLLAERIGGHVRESDVDRRRRTELADAELRKLALYRPGGTVSATDVDALVTEEVPGSTWAFLDAVAARTAVGAATVGERLLAAGVPIQVVVSQLHRRLRELILVREYLDIGARPQTIVKELKLQPFRARKLSEQAARWSLRELELALADLLALDLRTKGIALDGSTLQVSESIDALALQAWIARHAVAPGVSVAR